MLRVGAGGGVQKVTPKVLSFRQAAPPEARPAAQPAKVASAPTSWAAGASAWDDEELGDAEEAWGAEEEGGEGDEEAAAAPPARPPARSPAGPAATPAPRPGSLPAEATEEHGEPVLENEDWLKSFEQKWADAMATDAKVEEAADAEEPPVEPPRKRPRAAQPPPAEPPAATPATPATPRRPPAAAAGRAPPRRPTAAPARRAADAVAPITPAAAPRCAGPSGPGAAARADEIRDERPDWADRCTIDVRKPGQPQRLAISMAEVELGDAGMKEWCEWMGRRLAAEGAGAAPGARAARVRFKASTIDFSENKLSANGTKAVCNMLEKYGVRCDVLRLTGNNIGNEGARCIARYLMGSSQAPALELHLSRNKVTMDGVKWLLGSLALHPAYPVWNSDSHRFVPLWLKVENDKTKGAAGYKALKLSCKQLSCSVCLGETSGAAKCGPRQCVNGGCCDDLKHNCVAHLCGWEKSAASEPLPAPGAHARPMFDKPGRGAVKAPPSNAEAPLRDEPRLIYEDADLAVVLKPPGWSCLSQPAGLDPRWAKLSGLARRAKVGDLMCDAVVPALQGWLLLRFGADPNCDAARDQASDRGMAHRLDVDVSGPLLVGKTLRGYEHAKRQIVLGVLKDYVALVHGTFPTDRGECTAPIDSSKYDQEKRVRVSAEGQPASTVWEVVAEYECPETQEAYTLVHCRMVTLKTHQIRAHMQHLGNPIVGDAVYGEGEPPEWCPRIFIHKMRIGFFNVEGAACFETCSLQTAPDLWSALGGLRKVGGMAAKGCGALGL